MIISELRTSIDILRNVNAFENIDKETVNKLVACSKLISIQSQKRDQEEFELTNTNVYLLIKGKAYLACLGSDGKKIIAENLEKGDFFDSIGLFNISEKQTNSLFIEPFPKTTTLVCVFEKTTFIEILSQSHLLTTLVLSNLSKRISRLEEKIEELTLYSTEARILMELIKVGTPNGKNDLIEIESKVTHEKLAQSTGTVRETVSKSLSKLKKMGIIFYDKHKHMFIRLINKKKSKTYEERISANQ